MPRKPRRAKLEICGLSESGWLRLTARNGEKLMHGERVDKPRRARAAVLRAMVDVIEDSGRVVLTPEELGVIVDKAKTFGRYESHREAAKAAMGVTKAEEAGR